jgi:sister chromatid cohesion protein DCC1
MAQQSVHAAAVQVVATNQEHLEAVEIAPRLALLERLLAERPYGEEGEEEGADGAGVPNLTGEEEEEPDVAEPGAKRQRGEEQQAQRRRGEEVGGSGDGFYCLDDLEARVQASRSEIEEGLALLGAVSLPATMSQSSLSTSGRGEEKGLRVWRTVDPSYLGTLLELLVCTAQVRAEVLFA